MTCTHEAWERDVASEADGLCPLCLQAELSALRERVAGLEAAIKPFAEIPCLENFDDDQLFDPAGGVFAGDVRKARAALKGE